MRGQAQDAIPHHDVISLPIGISNIKRGHTLLGGLKSPFAGITGTLRCAPKRESRVHQQSRGDL